MKQEDTAENIAAARRISQVIFQHAARISQEGDVSRLLQLNADLGRDLTGADRCSVWLLDQSTGELWTEVAHGVNQIRIPAGSGIVGACVAENQPIIVNNASSDHRFFRNVDNSSGYRTESALVVPLRVGNQIMGAMQVLNKPGGFSDYDAELLGFMALYSASEIQTEKLRQEAEATRLLRRELDLAREVQRNLLPRKCKPVAGIDYTAFCRPARYVGGDYYDFLELPGGLFSVTVGDVSGKGIPAAVLMASIQTLLRSHLLRQALPLAAVISEINQTIYRCSSADRYSTLFCGVLDLKEKQFTYVNAGHVSPILVRRGKNKVEHLHNVGGLPIGMLPTSSYEEETIEIKPEDLIICISDGISEVVNAEGEMWDERQVEEVVQQYHHCPVNEIVKAIVHHAERYSAKADQYDDMTIAAIRIL